MYVDLPDYLSPCIIMGDSFRPDMILSTADKLYIIKLTVGFETNPANNARHKELQYRSLVTDLSNDYHSIEFINQSFHKLSWYIWSVVRIGFDNQHLNFIIFKLSTIAIRATFFKFWMRSKAWCNPKLLRYWTR